MSLLKKKSRFLFLLLIIFPGLFYMSVSCQESEFDVIIRNGSVIDGTGGPALQADLGIKGGRISEIGNLETRTATRIIDAGGLTVAPGFIDLHTHAERKILEFPSVENYIRQGVTTIVGGNCGGSPYPIGDFLEKVEETGIALNLTLLVGHNTVRREVMGRENRYATAEELQEMQSLVQKAMQDGAFGMSTGLKYIPGAYSNTEEVVALSKVVSKHGGFYATHMREEGIGLLDAVEEALNIGRQAGLPVHISHHKAVGKSMWGSSVKTLKMVDEAVEDGMDVTVDQYPYTATSTGLTVLFPAWSLEGGEEKIKKRLEDATLRARIKEGIVHNILYDRGGGDPATIVISSYPSDSALEGKNLAEITKMRGNEPTPENAAETLMDLYHAGGGRGIYHCLVEEDVVRIMKHPFVMHASDGATIEFGKAKPHPRSYGTYPRVLGRYVREQKVLSLEEAVRKMTSLPAKRLGLKDRGVLKKGMWADIVIFDSQKVIDRATWTEPHQYPEGIPFVLVNGLVVIDESNRTGEFPGKVLHGAASEQTISEK
ncbi:D-aminoacylase [candidate division KSB1 bacterium]|nr:D-aminoacylase [candidate division KSB1 bacterium]